MRLSPAQHTATGELVPEIDVFSDRETVGDVESRVHRRGAELDPLRRRGDRDYFVVPANLAGIGQVCARENFDECGFPRPVLPQEAMDLGGAYVKVHAVEGLRAREVLREFRDT